jgi:hypothetical protein
MNDYKDLEDANKEVERSKVILHDTENLDYQKSKEGDVEQKNETTEEDGSGIFTADGKELPKIDGGYDLIDPGGTLGDDELTSV